MMVYASVNFILYYNFLHLSHSVLFSYTFSYIFKKNDDLITDHRRKQQEDAAQEKMWADHTDHVVRLMEQNELQNRAAVREQNYQQNAEIQRQREELRQRKEESRKDAFGAIGSGFFDGFGTSCR